MRACPTGLPVKAHAPVICQVSNIRLRPSFREAHRSDAGPRKFFPSQRWGRQMRIFALTLILGLTACSGSKEAERSVAQCQLDASAPKGLAFRKNSAGTDFDAHAKNWDYREFMLTCMIAKGHQFQEVIDAKGKRNSMCYAPNADRRGVYDPFVDEPSCYL